MGWEKKKKWSPPVLKVLAFWIYLPALALDPNPCYFWGLLLDQAALALDPNDSYWGFLFGLSSASCLGSKPLFLRIPFFSLAPLALDPNRYLWGFFFSLAALGSDPPVLSEAFSWAYDRGSLDPSGWFGGFLFGSSGSCFGLIRLLHSFEECLVSTGYFFSCFGSKRLFFGLLFGSNGSCFGPKQFFLWLAFEDFYRVFALNLWGFLFEFTGCFQSITSVCFFKYIPGNINVSLFLDGYNQL